MESFRYSPPDLPLAVIHRDHALLVLDKPAGLLTVPGRGEDRADCLIARARAAFPEVLLVHRLDLDTSGVIVFALSPHAQRHLGRQFEDRVVEKRYLARVAGHPSAGSGEVDLPLAVDWPNRPRQRVDPAAGRPALTRWKVVRREADGTARVALEPRTGRSHQLRVHMAAIGHPILGDPLYARGPARDHPRMMLHAEGLRLRHPDGGRWMTFRAPPPF